MTATATRKCSACDLLMVDGMCPHCDDECRVKPCRHCKQIGAYDGVGPGSAPWRRSHK